MYSSSSREAQTMSEQSLLTVTERVTLDRMAEAYRALIISSDWQPSVKAITLSDVDRTVAKCGAHRCQGATA